MQYSGVHRCRHSLHSEGRICFEQSLESFLVLLFLSLLLVALGLALVFAVANVPFMMKQMERADPPLIEPPDGL